MENANLWTHTPGDEAKPDNLWALEFCALGFLCISHWGMKKPNIISLDHTQVAHEAQNFNCLPEII